MTPGQKTTLATAYKTASAQARLYTTEPTAAAAGTEVTGGTYAPQTITWGTVTNGVVTGSATFAVPAGVEIQGAGVHNSAGAFLDGGALPHQAFASDGTYTLSLTYTQS